MKFRASWLTVTLSAAALAAGGAAFSQPARTGAMASVAAQPAGTVSIEGPVTDGSKGFPYSASIVDLAPYGYIESEYFVSGKAHPFLPITSVLSDDGHWQVKAGTDEPYTTRILVRRPPVTKFNGTVVVEYMQEYYGTERDTNFRWNAETLLRRGFGWVGISMHHEGIDDPNQPTSITYAGRTFPVVTTLARWDQRRYGRLSVPSTDMSYDILTQVARALKTQKFAGGADPFAGLKVRHIMAAGNTIAGERLSIYINAVQPTAKVFDGFFLQDLHHGARLKLSGFPTPSPVVRTDVAVPVIVLNTTTASAERGPRPEGPKLRFWAPAGSSHTTGPYSVRVSAANRRDFGTALDNCPADYANTLPVQYVSSAAFIAIDRWIKTGKPAPSFPQLPAFTGAKEPVVDSSGYFDANGNVVGGLRTPWVDVPVARYDWRGECVGGAGRTFAFSPAKLNALYGTPQAYQRRFAQSVRAAVKRGVLLAEDARDAIAQAKKVTW